MLALSGSLGLVVSLTIESISLQRDLAAKQLACSCMAHCKL